MFLATLLYWYTCSASLHHVASGAQSWLKPRGGRMKCTIPYGLRTYFPIDLLCHVPSQILAKPEIKKFPSKGFLYKIYGSDLQAFHRHWTYFAILGWVQFNDHILETGLFKRMKALEKPQEKKLQATKSPKVSETFPHHEI
jgi:hypothetical protein